MRIDRPHRITARAQAPAHLDTFKPRHQHVDDHQVRRRLKGSLQSRLAAVGHIHEEARVRKPAPQQAGDALVIVDDEYPELIQAYPRHLPRPATWPLPWEGMASIVTGIAYTRRHAASGK